MAVYSGIRLMLGAGDNLGLAGETIGVMFVHMIIGLALVPLLCAKRFIALRGMGRSMRYFVNLNWKNVPPSLGIRWYLALLGIDWRARLAEPGKYSLRTW